MKVQKASKPAKKVTSIRLNIKLVERLTKLAEKDGRSFNNFVERFLERA
jgi:predicted DNA-binding protein